MKRIDIILFIIVLSFFVSDYLIYLFVGTEPITICNVICISFILLLFLLRKFNKEFYSWSEKKIKK